MMRYIIMRLWSRNGSPAIGTGGQPLRAEVIMSSQRIGWVASEDVAFMARILQMDMLRSILTFLVLVTSVSGCAKFREGDCIQNVEDGFIWRITAVHFNRYTMQGWFDGKWGLPVDGSFDTFDSGYVKISCPFSTQTLQEHK
jgi:hypothetical protein